MNDLLAGLLGALLSTNPPAAAAQVLETKTGIAVPVRRASSDPVEREYEALVAADDTALAEIDGWIKERRKEGEAGQAALRARIRERLAQVRSRYEAFFERHPNHSRARLAYGSFLSEVGEEAAGAEQWEKARELDPTNPAAWNNLANYYGHNSPVTKSFEYYQKAMELDPTEPVYIWNFATTVFLFRKDAREHWNITEEEVFEKAMKLYHDALALDPTNFLLAADLAKSYYGITVSRDWDEERQAARRVELAELGHAAWLVALKVARDETERQGVYVHLARTSINAGRYAEAEANLEKVTLPLMQSARESLAAKLARTRAASGEERGLDNDAP